MEYSINRYRTRKFGNKHFITTDCGSFCILNEVEYEKLKNNNFKEGDELFKKLEEREVVKTDNNILEIKRQTLRRSRFLSQGTSLHIIVLTERCNMDCVYCHASALNSDSNEHDMNKETATKIVDFLFQSSSEAITIEFQGGEPLLNWDTLTHIVEYAKNKNKIAKKDLLLTVVSNLSKMTDEKLKYLIDNNVDICTSFDGPKEIHDSNRPISGGSNYDDVVYWINRINEEYKKRNSSKRVSALTTLTKKSLTDPEGIVDEYINNGLLSVHLRFLNYLGRSEKNEVIHYRPEDFLNFWKKAMEYIFEKQKEGIDFEERMFDIMVQKLSEGEDPGYLDLRSPCGAVIGQMAYGISGKIYTCDEGRLLDEDTFCVGDVNNDTYKDVLTSKNTCAIVDASILDNYSTCKVCAYKPYCGICPVCNYAEQGNLVGKISQTDRCKIYKAQFDWLVEKFIINIEQE